LQAVKFFEFIFPPLNRFALKQSIYQINISKNMKKQILKLAFVLSIALLGEYSAKAQIVILRPRHEVVEIRGNRPGPRHYWRDGEWAWRGGAYVWEPGVWIVPERGRIWRRGHWKRAPGGYVWVPGHWK
jgi:hypothetical protein